MPQVSVIIPTCNRIESLGVAIKSVLTQTFGDFEIVVVDDAPQGYGREVVANLDDQRIKYIRHDANKGDAAARNTGILNSEGDYIAFLDDDDEWLPEKLELQVGLLADSRLEIGGVYSGIFLIDERRHASGAYIPPRDVNSVADLCAENIIATSSILLRRKCFDTIGLFDEKIPYNSDYDMWLRIAAEFKLLCVKKPLVKYATTGGQLSANYDKVIRGNELLIDKYHYLFAQNRKRCSRLYLSLGVLHCYNQHPTKGRKAFLKAIQLYPFEIRHYFNFGLSLLGANNFKRLKELKESFLWSHP